MNTTCVPGHELTKEPFRWDQRIFGLVMKLPGSVPIDINSNMFIPSAENHPLDAMCEVTGGEIIYTQCSSFLRVTTSIRGAQWLSGRVLDLRPKGRGFEPHRRHCVVVLEQDTFILA